MPLAEVPKIRLVSDEHGPRFHCLQCHDEPAAWRLYWCPGFGDYRANARERVPKAIDTSQCGRRKEHGPHTYAERCGCSDTNPVIAEHRRRIESFRVKKQQEARMGK